MAHAATARSAPPSAGVGGRSTYSWRAGAVDRPAAPHWRSWESTPSLESLHRLPGKEGRSADRPLYGTKRGRPNIYLPGGSSIAKAARFPNFCMKTRISGRPFRHRTIEGRVAGSSRGVRTTFPLRELAGQASKIKSCSLYLHLVLPSPLPCRTPPAGCWTCIARFPALYRSGGQYRRRRTPTP
jgi:hypothetical protein